MEKEELDKLVEDTDKKIQDALGGNIWYNPITDRKALTVGIFVNGGVKLIPEYKTLGASGMDVRANIKEAITLKPLERKLIPTGVYADIPEGYEFQLRPRSGLAYKKGLTLLNGFGTIDSDYIKEIGAIVVNLSDTPQTIEPSERVAQLVLMKVEKVEWHHHDSTDSFTSKDRDGGFGSTGKQ